MAHTTADNMDPTYDYAFMDTACDTCGIGGRSWVIESLSGRKVQIAGYDTTHTVKNDIPIGSGITAVDLPTGETILLRVHEASVLNDDAHTLFSTLQLRENGVEIDDRLRRHGGASCMYVDNYVIPFTMIAGMVTVKIRKPTEHELVTCDIIDLTSPDPWHPAQLTDQELNTNDYASLVHKYDTRMLGIRRTQHIPSNIAIYEPYFLYPGSEVMEATLKNTTQYGHINMRIPMQQHVKSRNTILQRHRFQEPYATDTWHSTITSYEGYNSCQVFVGIKSTVTSHYGLQRESQGPEALLDFFRQEGVPLSLTRDGSKMQANQLWQQYCRNFFVKDKYTEPYHPHQNPAERALALHKTKIQRLMIDTGCDPRAWFKAACHVAAIHNHTARKTLLYRTPLEVRDGLTPDISALVQFKFWEEVYYQQHPKKFPRPGGNEGKGRWLGHAPDYGDHLCYYILTDDTTQIIVRSMVRPVVNSPRPN